MIVGAIVLIWMALLNQANCSWLASDLGLLAQNNRELDIDEVRQLLLKGSFRYKFDQTTVEELLRLDAKQVEHCNMVVLDICEKVKDDKDLAYFCQNRLNKLAKFCATRFDQFIDAELKKSLGWNPRLEFGYYIVRATKSMGGERIDDIRPRLKDYIRTTAIPYTRCFDFFKAMKLTEAILERSGYKFADMVFYNDSLSDLFLIYELCQAHRELQPEIYESLLERDLLKQKKNSKVRNKSC